MSTQTMFRCPNCQYLLSRDCIKLAKEQVIRDCLFCENCDYIEDLLLSEEILEEYER